MKKKLTPMKAFLMISQISISMIVPIFLSSYIGYRLDMHFETGYWFIVFLILGIAAAFRNIYKLTKPFYADDLKAEQKEQAYWDSLHSNRPKDRGAAEEIDRSALSKEERIAMGIASRRERQKETADDTETSIPQPVKTRAQEAEEEFDAWRKRNGR